jgi:tetratricopeptide (TPR) repeat protein
VLYYRRRFDEAIVEFRRQRAIPDRKYQAVPGGLIELARGRPADALPYCEPVQDSFDGQVCVAIAYRKLDRPEEAEAIMQRMLKEQGEFLAFQYVMIYAQWGQAEKALDWLEKAVELKDPGLLDVVAEPLLDPIRTTPRFAVVLKRLKLPP